MFKSGDQLFILPKRTTKRTKNLTDAVGIPPPIFQMPIYIL